MGGPCFVIEETVDAEGLKKLDRKKGPACTDNFQVRPFEFQGKQWHSVEQCYQAMKFVGDKQQEIIRACAKYEMETEWDYGIRVWQLGQYKAPRPEFEKVKVEIMYQVNVAKYLAHPDLQAELLSTGDKTIVGAPSTSNWKVWNGLIQMRIRKEVGDGILGKDQLTGKALEDALNEPMRGSFATGLVQPPPQLDK